MGRDRRQQEGSVLVKKRFSSHVQPSSSLGSGNATSDPRLSPVVVDSLPGSSQERCVKGHGPTIARKTVCTGHDRDRDRVFLESVPSTQAFRRLAFSHRPIGAQRIRSAENLRDGHDGEGQESSASGHVGHLARPLRCVSSYTDKAARSEVSVLPSRRNKVHVHGPAIWIDDGPMGVHGSSQANKEVDDPSPVRAVSVPRRLAQRPPQPECAGPQDGCAGTALSTTWFAGEREEIGTRALAVNRVPGGAAGSSSGQGLSDPRESGWDPHDDRADPSGRRGAFLKSRVSVGYASSDDADGSIGTVEPPSAPTTGNSEIEKGPSRRTADPGVGSVGAIPEMVDVRGSSADRIRFPSALPSAYDLH